MKIETKHFYINISQSGFTIAVFNSKWDVELHFHIIKFKEEFPK